jgi:S-DNA-T family DNA segregation ATPase FtsK/SpoIIIE
MESAYPAKVRPGSGRVTATDDAQVVQIKFILSDPHANPVPPPRETLSDRILLGLFETGDDIIFSLVNTLIGGMTGAGKSGVLNILIRALAKIPNVALILVDLKPGAPEFTPWRSVAHSVISSPEDLSVALDQLMLGMHTRGEIMARRGWKKWRPTRSQPHVVVIVDEVQGVKKAGLGGKLDTAIGLVRAYAITFVVATQYPTDANVSMTVKEQCPQKIGLAVEDQYGENAVFGPRAARQGWNISEIPMEGYLLIRSPQYRTPVRGRSYFMADEDIPAEAARLAEQRTVISEDWMELDAGSGMPEVVDAVVIESDPVETVFGVVCGKSAITAREVADRSGLPLRTVQRHLKVLISGNRIVKDSGGYSEMP